MLFQERMYNAVVSRFPFFKKIYRFFLGPKRYKYIFSSIQKNKCRKIMEIGTWDGDNALRMILEAKKVHGKKVEYYGFDLFDSMTDKLYEYEVSKNAPTMNFLYKKLRQTGCKISLVKGDTNKSLPTSLSKLPKMDLIFIDGGHSLKTIENDWEYAQKLMHKDTLVIFDDYWNRMNAGCKPLIDAIDRSKFDVTVLPTKDTFKKEDGLLTINLAQVSKQ